MLEKRSQGRPCRGGNEVGRSRIVDSLRDMMRAEPDGELSRKNLAKFAGVTPALITYYFPGRDALIEEAARPVIEAHFRELDLILSGGEAPDVTLKSIIHFLFRCYRRDIAIISAYRALVRRQGDSRLPDYLLEMSRRLGDFFKESGADAPRRALMLQAALWGICQYGSEATRIDSPVATVDGSVDDVETIFDMFAASLPMMPSVSVPHAPFAMS